MARISDLPSEVLLQIFTYAIFQPNTLGLRLIDYKTAWSLIAVDSRFCEVSIDVASRMNRSVAARRYWRTAEKIAWKWKHSEDTRARSGSLLEAR